MTAAMEHSGCCGSPMCGGLFRRIKVTAAMRYSDGVLPTDLFEYLGKIPRILIADEGRNLENLISELRRIEQALSILYLVRYSKKRAAHHLLEQHTEMTAAQPHQLRHLIDPQIMVHNTNSDIVEHLSHDRLRIHALILSRRLLNPSAELLPNLCDHLFQGHQGGQTAEQRLQLTMLHLMVSIQLAVKHDDQLDQEMKHSLLRRRSAAQNPSPVPLVPGPPAAESSVLRASESSFSSCSG